MKLEVGEVQISVDTCFESGVSLEAGSKQLEAGFVAMLRCLRSCYELVADFLSVFINRGPRRGPGLHVAGWKKDAGCSDVAEFEGGMPSSATEAASEF